MRLTLSALFNCFYTSSAKVVVYVPFQIRRGKYFYLLLAVYFNAFNYKPHRPSSFSLWPLPLFWRKLSASYHGVVIRRNVIAMVQGGVKPTQGPPARAKG
jgi:hypothetical protein